MDKTILKVHVNPKSSVNSVVKYHNSVLHIKITALPIDGEANKACVKFMSDLFNIKKSAVSIISGQTNKNKTFELEGISSEKIIEIINEKVCK